MVFDIESKYNLVIFSTFAKRETTRRRQEHQSNMPHADALRKFNQSQQIYPFQNKRSSDNFVLGLLLTVCALLVTERYTKHTLTFEWWKNSLPTFVTPIDHLRRPNSMK